MAVAFLSVAAGAICAPLNPAYRVNEFEFYLSDLRAKALIIQSKVDSAAVSVAQARGIPIIELAPLTEGGTGAFTLRGGHRSSAAAKGFAEPDDVALVLHTSGTTSRPKIVPLTQSNICTSAHNIRIALNLTSIDRCLNVMPLFHIHGLIGAILSSLAAGASVICTPGFYAPKFFEWMDEFTPTWYTAVPTMHQAILSRAAQNQEVISRSRLRLIRSSSSALPPRVMAELERVFGIPVIESYGMTEAAHQMASNPLPPGQRKPGSVGKAAGPQIAIMGDRGELLPPGMTGEIVIRGANVTRGYENNPTANEATLTKGWFRTGDQGRVDTDGYLFITGRTKEIINRGGEKISPREIDEVLLDHPAVAQATAFPVPDERLGEEVGVAVVLREDASVSETELREFIATRLTDFKVPRQVIFLDDIPKGPTGKPQRIGLAEKLGLTQSTHQKAKETGLFSAPRTRTETLLAEIWREVLRLETVGIHHNFFLLGGDSILAAQFISRIRDTLNAELSMVRLFEMPTVAKLAAWLDSANHSEVQSKVPPIRPFPRTGETPLSFAQERMWFLAQYEEANTAYLRTAAFRLKGVLNVEAFQQSLTKIVERHEVLRTTFHSRDGLPAQIVSEACPVPVRHQDLSDLHESERMRRFLQLAREEVHRPFDLSRDLMLRSTLFRLGGQDHVLLLTMHHIASDGWSQGVVLNELNEFYNGYCVGLPPKLPKLPIQYADFAIWQREVFQGQTLARDLTYWREKLSGAPAVLRLPTDHQRSGLQTYRGARQSLTLSKGLTESLKDLSSQERVTLFMTLLAGFNAVLFRYTGQEDILVGTPVANRNRVEFEGVVGCFVNTLVLRTTLSGDPSFRELLRRVREMALEAYAHQDLPFEKLVEMLQPERNLSYSPVFQVMFSLRNLHAEVPSLGGLKVEEIDCDTGAAQFDLRIEVIERGEDLSCRAIYNTDLFEAETVRRLLGHYQTLLEGAVKDPDSRLSTLPILTESERRQLLVEWNQTQKGYPQKCIHELFEEQVERTPEAVAVVHEERELSYGKLNARANQLAHYLRELGVKPDGRVAICMERGLEMVVGLLAVLKAGGAYVPLDPAYPAERLNYMLEDSAPSVLLTQGRLKGMFTGLSKGLAVIDLADSPEWANQPESNPGRASVGLTPEHLAYVIYTSGSTGMPKGVMNEHRGVVNRLVWMQSAYGLDVHDTVLQKTPFSFDVSVWEFFCTLLVGARLVMARPEGHRDAAYLIETIRQENVTTMHFVPSMLQVFLEHAEVAQCSNLVRVVCSGEALPAALARRFQELLPRTELCNLYGPTEAAVDVTAWTCTPNASIADIPIGRPIANTRICILDGHGQPVPIGVAGEIYIGGVGVARGYLNRPELTAERFVRDPFALEAGARMYKTGDLGRWLPDGTIEFLGRNDFQVKVRGCRVELGEIEARLREHVGAREVVVIAREESPGDKRLVAYYTGADTGELGERAVGAEELRRHLAERLPEYMVPAAYMRLKALPLTPNGKLDRKALPAPEGDAYAVPGYEAPVGEVETTLAGIWADVLKVERVGRRDHFFDLGGHSLLAMQAVSRMNREFKLRLRIREFFEAPTVRAMAQTVTQAWKHRGQSGTSGASKDCARG
jgi:amino acid adenylation domain-containing protein